MTTLSVWRPLVPNEGGCGLRLETPVRGGISIERRSQGSLVASATAVRASPGFVRSRARLASWRHSGSPIFLIGPATTPGAAAMPTSSSGIRGFFVEVLLDQGGDRINRGLSTFAIGRERYLFTLLGAEGEQ